MFVHVSANEITKHVPSQLNELARNGALWHEVKYRQGSEIFGEARRARQKRAKGKPSTSSSLRCELPASVGDGSYVVLGLGVAA
jgi:hypothetical protein